MNRKTIKVDFLDFWDGFDKEHNMLIDTLRKNFNVEVTKDADYVFFSLFGESHWRVPDNVVKIEFVGENIVPDFNACDYGIGFEWMNYEDRYFRLPLYLFYPREMLARMEHKHEIPQGWDLSKEKPDFCGFMVSNPKNPKRNEMFAKLSSYKKVNSGGRFMNNVGGPVADKFAFDSRHKFSLCFENGAHNGYTTEKLPDAFAARTIPIYWGDPKVELTFNPEAFINVNKIESLDQVVEIVKELDNDDEKYMNMLRQPAMLPSVPTVDQEHKAFEEWLVAIIDQPVQAAYRRNRELFGKGYIDSHRKLKYPFKLRWRSFWRNVRKKLKNLFKKS